jgi:hypothetical protein
LALAVGRALRHDGFFHDLSYEESLYDDEKMIYQFRDMMEMPKQDQDTKGDYLFLKKKGKRV